MKKLGFPRLACGLMIGVFLPLGTVSATDANDRIQSRLGEGGPGTYYSSSTMDMQRDTWSASQGAQGPIRSDMIEDKRSYEEKEAARNAMDKVFFPLNADGG